MWLIACQIGMAHWPKAVKIKAPSLTVVCNRLLSVLIPTQQTRILLRKTFWNFITNLLHNVMEGPFFLPVIILQPQSIFIKDSSKASGHRNCKGRRRNWVQRLLFHSLPMIMTSVDLPRQPTHPSLDFYSHWFGAYKDWSVETLGGGLVQSFISNSVCKTRGFLTSLFWEQGVQTRPRQHRGPGKFLPNVHNYGESSVLPSAFPSCAYGKEPGFNCNLSQLSKHLAN